MNSDCRLQAMTNKLLIENRADGVTTLIFNRLETRNALDLETMQAFRDAVDDLKRESSLRESAHSDFDGRGTGCLLQRG
jgi:hypothetical protein